MFACLAPSEGSLRVRGIIFVSYDSRQETRKEVRVGRGRERPNPLFVLSRSRG